ncbi:MAG: hypothetical protein HY849_06595 [Nitrosomonadales bacterium]|nr:hypothetical protein [Nitrosomonadales bacterium]
MQLPVYSPSDYADAQRDLLPPGAAFDWPQGGFGRTLLNGMGAELARIGVDAQTVLDSAITTHQPKYSSWHIREYRRVAQEAIAGVTETLPRKAFRVGSRVGDRLWSSAAPTLNFPVELVRVDHRLGRFCVGSHVGDQLWSADRRYMLRVRYYRSVVNPKLLWDALTAFKQAHVYLWFEDITGAGGNYGEN